MRNPHRQLQGSFWLMMVIQTINAVDMPGKGTRKMPSPRAYLATIVLWSIFGLISDAGGERAAAAMGWVTVLSGAVLGTAGKTLTDFLASIADLIEIPGKSIPKTGTGKAEQRPAAGTPQPPKTQIS